MAHDILRQRAFRDAVVLTAAFALAWPVMALFDVAEWLHERLRDIETIEGDELVLAIAMTGLGGFIYAIRRVRDLWCEVKRRRAAEEEARWSARHDVLTRLPNRRFVERWLADRSASGQWMTAYAIDLDGFKKVNDLMGHVSGDRLLTTVADRLGGLDPQAFVARVGGDEFVILRENEAPDVDPRDFGAAIVTALSAPTDLDGVAVDIGASVGIAVYPGDVATVANVLHHADIAMYAAKRGGRNRVVRFDQALEAAALERARDEVALRRALQAGEIVPHFQPLIDLKTGRIQGFEALARWCRSDGVSVPPEQFVPLAEEIGLIVELSDMLLTQACQAAVRWPAGVTLSFNISPTQFSDHLLGLRVARVLGATGLAPQRLIIEITENGLLRDREAALRIIDDLKTAGIRVALDDFGIGYSSLSYLATLAVDEIKIDRSFVADCLSDPRQMKIITAIVALGHGLGLRITAEGVEQVEQVERLRRVGCNAGQGFLFGSAVPAGETLPLLAAHDAAPQRQPA